MKIGHAELRPGVAYNFQGIALIRQLLESSRAIVVSDDPPGTALKS